MSAFTLRKSTGNEPKSATLGSTSKQNVVQDPNKRRSLLQDNSWIKARAEKEEDKPKDENYGKNILNRYKSQDDLDRDTEKEDTKPVHNRFKSDDALDRISLKNTSERGNRSATLERLPSSENTEPDGKRQTWSPGNRTTTTTTTEETKRQPWTPSNRTSVTTTETKQSSLPGKQDGQKITIFSSDAKPSDKPRSNLIDSARSRFEKPDEKPKLPPTPTSPVPKTDIRSKNAEDKPFVMPKLSPVKPDDKPSYPAKPPVSQTGDRRSVVERKQRSQDIDNLIDISTTKPSSNKGNLDDLIEISSNAKNLRNRDEEINNLIEIKKPQRSRDEEFNNLIEIKKPQEKSRDKEVNNLIEIKKPQERSRDKELNNLIEINKPQERSRDKEVNNLIEIKKPQERSRKQDLNDLIDVSTTARNSRGSQNLDDLIAISGDGKKGTAGPSGNTSSVTQSSTTTTIVTENTYDIQSRRSTSSSTDTENIYDVPSKLISTTYKSNNDPKDTTNRRSNTTTTTTTTTYNINDDLPIGTSRRSATSYKAGTDTTDAPNESSTTTVVHNKSYTSPGSDYHTYKVPHEADDLYNRNSAYPNKYDDSVKSSSIKTVYSTADRTVIQKDMCTYCRKPLGLDAKMILKDMNICCHATCFKCEVCSGNMGGMRAGDSMWIYRQSIHCEPCYFKARERWII